MACVTFDLDPHFLHEANFSKLLEGGMLSTCNFTESLVFLQFPKAVGPEIACLSRPKFPLFLPSPRTGPCPTGELWPCFLVCFPKMCEG